jgi:hypothetical protein
MLVEDRGGLISLSDAAQVRPALDAERGAVSKQLLYNHRIVSGDGGFQRGQLGWSVENESWTDRISSAEIFSALDKTSDLGFVASAGGLSDIDRLMRPHRVPIA